MSVLPGHTHNTLQGLKLEGVLSNNLQQADAQTISLSAHTVVGGGVVSKGVDHVWNQHEPAGRKQD